MKRIHPEDPRVTAHALGELPAHEAAEIDRAAMVNPAVQEAVLEAQQLAALIRAGYTAESHELGEARREAIRRAGRQPVAENLVSIRKHRSWVRPVAACAAAAALVVGLVWVMQQIPSGEGPAVADNLPAQLEDLQAQILMTPAPRPAPISGFRTPRPQAASSLFEVGTDLEPGVVERELAEAKELQARDPQEFERRVREMAQKAAMRSLAKLPELTDNPFVSAMEAARSSVPLVAGHSSYPLVERFIRTGEELPPRNGVRIEELVNHVSYEDEGDADLDGIKLGAEIVRCPWDEGALLMGVLLRNGSEKEIAEKAILQVEVKPDHIRSYRLIGYAEVAADDLDEKSLAKGLPPGKSNYVLYQLQPSNTEVFENHRVVARVALRLGHDEARGLIVPVTSPPRDWAICSNNLQTAVSLAAWGMLLRDCPYRGALSTGVLETLVGEALVGVPEGDLARRESLQLILDSLPLLRGKAAP